uniref:Rhodanese domain-containing protein n=1 Tax=Lutzomyia longipalpis TaxID=7200 RepID=A0A1B0CWL5_LUTLO
MRKSRISAIIRRNFSLMSGSHMSCLRRDPFPRPSIFHRKDSRRLSQIPNRRISNFTLGAPNPNSIPSSFSPVAPEIELPGLWNLPKGLALKMGQVQTIFSDETSNEDFRGRFGREKPAKESQIIFMCKIGVRSGKAADAVTQMGYRNAKNYKGSWTEWAEKENLPNPQK